MPARAVRWGMAWAGLLALAFAGGAQAQQTPAYKCVSKGRVVYSQIPCAGARPIGSAKPRVNVRYETPSQDRAKVARRATLTDAERHECTGLDARLHEQEAEVRSLGDAASLQDEMPLVRTRKRYRELKC